MVFLSGPRQCGKTTLAKTFLLSDKNYFNWDQLSFKKRWTKNSEAFAEELLHQDQPRIILDEFHKNPKWKNQLKGFYDLYGDKIEIILTGSAQLNTFRRGADSLLGRFFHFHLHPFSLGELVQKKPMNFSEFSAFIQKPLEESEKNSTEIKNDLFIYGGFPEPFVAQNKEMHQIWSKNRLELLIRQDLKDLSNIINTGHVEILASFLPDRVSSPLSIQSLVEDLDVAHTTVSRWLNALAMVYYHFEIKPYSKSIPRSLKKEGKFYLYDWSTIESEGPRFENMVASHLLKLVDYYNDTGQADLSLNYLRDKDKNEVDFILTNRKKPILTIEAKFMDVSLDKTYEKFQRHLKVPHFQIINKPGVLRKFEKAYVMSFASFFKKLP